MRIFILSVFLSLHCFAQESNVDFKLENIELNSPYLFYPNRAEEQVAVLKALDYCFSKTTSEWEDVQENFLPFWKDSEKCPLPSYHDFLMLDIQIKRYSKPVILSMLYIDEKYHIKIAWIDKDPKRKEIHTIYNIIADKNLKFENILSSNMDLFHKKEIEGLTFYTKNPLLLKEKDIKKALAFNSEMASFYELPKINYTLFIFENYHEMKISRGFDFDSDMQIGSSTGGESITSLDLVFSGNGSANYPHEVVHLYNAKKMGEDRNRILDEGIATYFGGSGGLNFKECVQELKSFMERENKDFYKILTEDSNIVMNEKLSFEYTFGALLTHIILKKYDKNALFKLAENEVTREEFRNKIMDLFNIKPEEFHSFFMKEIENLIQKEEKDNN